MDSKVSIDWKKTACILCECNCGLEVQLGGEDGRRLVRFRGDKAHPASQGYACEKPHRLDHYQNGSERLTQPLRRKPDGTFEPIDWDTAIQEVTARLKKIEETYGGDTIMYYGGGGQGNHLPGAYATATRRVFGSRYRSNALAQEKTGEFWVSHRMLGIQTRGDFEHCEVALFLGKNPWFSHGIPRTRTTLKEMAKDPGRKMIVIDPRRTKTAQLADIHLQVKPGTDAWLLSAMISILLKDELTDNTFIEEKTTGFSAIAEAFKEIDVSAYCSHAGVPEELVREAVQVIGKAKSFASYEDLGVQMNHHSTLVSYLHRMLWLLTGNFGRKGTHYSPTTLVNIANGNVKRNSPVTQAPLIGGLIPCNSIADEILTEHPQRFRGMLIETANPAHSLADSPKFREALEALDTVVVIDIAMTETAKCADYILPASTQFEKAEATFFNFEFPENYFQLRPAILEPIDGPLPEAEIHARIVEAAGGLDDVPMDELRVAAQQGLAEYTQAFAMHVAMNPARVGVAPAILYRTLGPALPKEQAEGAVLFGLVLKAAMQFPEPLARAGFDGSPMDAAVKLFDAIIEHPAGVVFAIERWEDVPQKVATPGGKIRLELPELLEEVAKLTAGPIQADPAYPFVLSAGERRSFTANTIFRDDTWRKKDAEGALRISPEDAQKLGLQEENEVLLTTRRGSARVRVSITDTMRPGHISLPNGMGLDGSTHSLGGIALNELTEAASKDAFAGTPFHKYVPAQIEVV